MLEQLELNELDELNEINNMSKELAAVALDERDDGIICVKDAKPSEPLQTRLYQNRVIENVLKAVDAGHKSILIELPTGAGKTICAHLLAKALYDKHKWQFGWTCMRRVLVQQAADENRRKFGYDFGKYFSTFRHEFPSGIDVLIEDEAQHSASATATAMYGTINPKVHIALTATPYRTDHMKLCFSKVIRDAGIRQLVDEGWLSKFHQYMYDDVWTPDNVANLYLNDMDRWGKSVMFFSTKEQCYQAQASLASKGVESEVVIGGNIATQQRQIDRFKNNEIPVLINVYVLTEGFDSNELKTVFLRPSAKGPTQQMGGRALRIHKDKPFANIVQNYATHYPFHVFASPADRFNMEQGKWVSRSLNIEKIKKVTQRVGIELAKQKSVPLPKYILARARNPRFRSVSTAGGGEAVPE